MRKPRNFNRSDVASTNPPSPDADDFIEEPPDEEPEEVEEPEESEVQKAVPTKLVIPQPSGRAKIVLAGVPEVSATPNKITNRDSFVPPDQTTIMPVSSSLSFLDTSKVGVSDKILKKRKQQDKETVPAVQALAASMAKKLGGDKVMLGDATMNMIIGIPCPFPVQFLLGSRVLPLSIVIHLLAKWGSGKSALVAEIIRWCIMLQGFGVLQEVESKFSPFWFRSIIGPKLYDENFAMIQADSVQEWQHNLQLSIDNQKSLTSKTKKGLTYPVCFAVDSIMGKLSDEGVDKIKEEGSAGRAMPIEALSIGRYLKTAASWIRGHPYLLLLVNHLKDKINKEQNESARSWSGGGTLGFQETYEIELTKYGSPINTANANGFHLAVKCYKNSLGVNNRTIFVRVLWWNKMLPKGGFEQVSVWDWDWATVKLLHHITSGAGNNVAPLRQALKDIGFHLACPKVSEVENLAWCANLGMREKDALPWHELGRLIVQDKQLLGNIQTALGLHEFRVLEGDYAEQLLKIKKKSLI